MGVHIQQTEPYSPWQNAAEGAIRELKQAAGHKIARTHSSRVLWDHCLELEALIQSYTALDYHELNGQVPETITLARQMVDISALASFGWYDWVKYWDLKASFPEPKGKWLGPAIDIGPAMTS